MSLRFTAPVLSVSLAAVIAGSMVSGAAASKPACGFGGGDDRSFHLITEYKGISCEGARKVLRGLRGSRTLIPMACHKSRVLDGWTLTNLEIDADLVVAQYSRGAVTIVYQRLSFKQVGGCAPRGDQGFDEAGV